MRIGLSACLVVLGALGALGAACNSISGVSDYVNVDCVADCGAASDAAGSGDGAQADGATTGDASGSGDAADDVLPACPANQGRVTLTVKGSTDTIGSNPSGLSVPTGSTGSACFPLDRVELRTQQRSANWTGPTCDNGNSGQDTCRFVVPSAGIDVTATIL